MSGHFEGILEAGVTNRTSEDPVESEFEEVVSGSSVQNAVAVFAGCYHHKVLEVARVVERAETNKTAEYIITKSHIVPSYYSCCSSC